MTIRERPIKSHLAHSRRLLAHAEEWLEKGDRLQASEKAWGAVAHYFKVIADSRGWAYDTHTDAFQVAHNIAIEQDNTLIRQYFSIAYGMRINFYRDIKPLEFLRDELENVKELMDILERIDIE